MYEEQIQAVIRAHKMLHETGKDVLDNSLIVLRADSGNYIVRVRNRFQNDLDAMQIFVVNRDGITADGKKIDLDLRFFVDVKMLERYDWMNCVVNSTMKYSTIWNQSEVALPPLSTIHAKYFFGEVPVSAPINYTRGDSFVDVVSQEVLEVLRYGNPKKCRGMFVPKVDTIIWGESLDEAVELALALESLAEHAWEVAKESNGCMRYLPYALVDEVYREYHKE
ncbi:MAG: class II aldolase/adducin family protein [Lachnospiraceae bacterium]|nr:class II aldolase/adducin family protein [Lachnospiraceae bacterium]